MFYNSMLLILVFSVIVMFLAWSRRIGYARSFGAAFCRIMWMLPILLSLKPKLEIENAEQPVNQELLSVFVDDTHSMSSNNGEQYNEDEIQGILENKCRSFNCIVNITKYSDLLERADYTDLNEALKVFFIEHSGRPWVVFTDGKDQYPKEGWSKSLGVGGDSNKGLLIGTRVDSQPNFFIEKVYVKPIGFKNKSIDAQVRIKKTQMPQAVEKFQLQISHSSGVIKTTTGEFPEGSDISVVDIILPPLATGNQILKFEILPHPDEKATWDNVSYHPVTVMENTEGVLHLLGSPSWDGRYMRRYIKSEPKFDTISFFILRDPTDSNVVEEREMSLIPFPVSTLFDEELPNFKLVIMQDFSISMFLQNPKLQKNLVDYVKNGGGFLFTGGKRALLDPDVLNSPMAEILPFKLKSSIGSSTGPNPASFPLLRRSREIFSRKINKNGPWYDPDLELKVVPSRLAGDEMSLVPFMYEWSKMSHVVFNDWIIKGAHHMENVVLRSGVTTLLEGQDAGLKSTPLAVASYPGKGRAVWFFTDQLSEITRGDSAYSKAYYYNQFLGSLTTWLTRNERNKPLSINAPRIKSLGLSKLHINMLATGPVSSELIKTSDFRFSICGKTISPTQVIVDELGNESVNIATTIESHLPPGSPCRVAISGENKNGGRIEASGFGVIPVRVSETSYVENGELLSALSKSLEAPLLSNKSEVDQGLDQWFLENFDESLVLKAKINRSTESHYWPLDLAYSWLLLIFIPGEIIFRRLHEILG